MEVAADQPFVEIAESSVSRNSPTARSRAGETAGAVQVLDPLRLPDWDALLATHRESTFFHRRAWASVLHDTYGHRPSYFCHIRGDRLEAMLPAMEVSSLWTGRRGVSLPFTDTCGPLRGSDDAGLYEAAMGQGKQRGWRYLECRSDGGEWPGATPSLAFHGHVIDLARPGQEIYASFHPSVRRSIRKAQAAHLKVEFATTLESMRAFYTLHCLSRKRHGVPPQPFRFFENIARHVLGSGTGFVASASVEQRVVAAAVFFHWGTTAFYKFGASDYAYQYLRANDLVMWEAIKRCAESGCACLHLGRTSLANQGLRQFKLRFGAREETLAYCKYDFRRQRFVKDTDRAEGWINRVFRLLPAPLFRMAGQILYPHLS